LQDQEQYLPASIAQSAASQPQFPTTLSKSNKDGW
jgi:hypothetical protein